MLKQASTIAGEIETIMAQAKGEKWVEDEIAATARSRNMPVPPRGSITRLTLLHSVLEKFGSEAVATTAVDKPAELSSEDLRTLASEFVGIASPTGQKNYYLRNKVALQRAADQDILGKNLKKNISDVEKRL